jgi:carbonic anhydrase/acetyltransferase-like protein (isoleucine patch superfamily)
MPHIGPDVVLNDPACIHETALIHGAVTLEPGSSVWPYAVMRCEMFEIRIGENSNIQDFVMIHAGITTGTSVGKNCSITHHATIHGCEIGDNCLIGIGATIMDGAQIGANSIVAGHSIVNEGKRFPPNSVIAGVPAKIIDTRNNTVRNLLYAAFCHRNALNYPRGQERMSNADLAYLAELQEKNQT